MKTHHCFNALINQQEVRCRDKLLCHGEWVWLKKDSVLHSLNQPNQSVYFPSGAVLVLTIQSHADKGLALALIGEEGLYGIEALLGATQPPTTALVHAEGMALKVTAWYLLKLMRQHQALQTSVYHFMAISNAQLAQTCVCIRFHLVQARLAKLLLMLHDRLHSSSFFITHDLLSSMLGVRRVGVTKAAGLLQKQAILHYSRGHLEILNHAALEHVACSCYQRDQRVYRVMTDDE